MAVSASAPPLRSIAETEQDLYTAARLSRALDLALLRMCEFDVAEPDDIAAVTELSFLVMTTAARLLDDFNALHAAGVLAPVWGPREGRP